MTMGWSDELEKQMDAPGCRGIVFGLGIIIIVLATACLVTAWWAYG